MVCFIKVTFAFEFKVRYSHEILPSQAFRILYTMPRKDGTRRINDDEWDKHKSHIIQLYIERGKKLEDVANIMTRDHNFTAS